jgi:Putative amidoligase enzyme
MEELTLLMNKGQDRHYKLNLQNLRTGRQPTIEFRQHSSTMNYDKISAWVCLCARFCHYSATSAPPSLSLSNEGIDSEQEFHDLFWYVVKDRALMEAYYERRLHLLTVKVDDSDTNCCSGCAEGGKSLPTKGK